MPLLWHLVESPGGQGRLEALQWYVIRPEARPNAHLSFSQQERVCLQWLRGWIKNGTVGREPSHVRRRILEEQRRPTPSQRDPRKDTDARIIPGRVQLQSSRLYIDCEKDGTSPHGARGSGVDGSKGPTDFLREKEGGHGHREDP